VSDGSDGRLHIGALVGADHERTGEDVLLDASSLTTHGLIVGMTGSGKTGLGVALVEEALLEGVPVLVLDPKADLGNLALTYALTAITEEWDAKEAATTTLEVPPERTDITVVDSPSSGCRRSQP
jgi:DNA helicase HerA-like ATPase